MPITHLSLRHGVMAGDPGLGRQGGEEGGGQGGQGRATDATLQLLHDGVGHVGDDKDDRVDCVIVGNVVDGVR